MQAVKDVFGKDSESGTLQYMSPVQYVSSKYILQWRFLMLHPSAIDTNGVSQKVYTSKFNIEL